jgi:hypothetical protein
LKELYKTCDVEADIKRKGTDAVAYVTITDETRVIKIIFSECAEEGKNNNEGRKEMEAKGTHERRMDICRKES